ncbi:MAG: hypothetical protein ABJP45_16550 [Cyclobacteriaceae bacterium]
MNSLKKSVIILAILLVGCSKVQDAEDKPKEENAALDFSKNNEFETIVIEECEYIIVKKSPRSNQGFGLMSHKGNCKNPIHVYNSMDTAQLKTR